MYKSGVGAPVIAHARSRANPFAPLVEVTQDLGAESTYQMVTFNHNLHRLGKGGDEGGPFFLNKTELTWLPTSNVNFNDMYIGDAWPWPYDNLNPGGLDGDSTLYVQGAKAIAATQPTNSEWSASQFIGEALQDGAPGAIGSSLWRSQTLRAKNAGDEYLNVEYGWLPLVSDIRNFAKAVKNSHSILDEYRRGSGKKTRKRFKFPTVESNSVRFSDDFVKTVGSSSAVPRVRTMYSLSQRKRTWFSGAYRYFLPVPDDVSSRFGLYRSYADKLLGVRIPSPEDVWNVAPWSWAIDWKVDVGTILHNYSSIGKDGLVLEYGYIMQEFYNSTFSTSQYGMYGFTNKICYRLPATPFGFGVDLSGLSAQQTSILVALGLSRT